MTFNMQVQLENLHIGSFPYMPDYKDDNAMYWESLEVNGGAARTYAVKIRDSYLRERPSTPSGFYVATSYYRAFGPEGARRPTIIIDRWWLRRRTRRALSPGSSRSFGGYNAITYGSLGQVG